MGIDRKDINNKYKWKIDLMYSSKESIDKDIENIKSYINEIKQYKGKLSQSKENLYEALNIYEKASQLLQNLYVYTHMKQHEDTRINENQAMATKTDMLSTELSTVSSYMVPEIISIDESKLKEYLEDEKLSFYKKYIDEILREKPHTLSEKEEEILAAVSDLTSVPENAYDMLSYADMEFPEIENEDGEIVKLTHSNFSTSSPACSISSISTRAEANFSPEASISSSRPSSLVILRNWLALNSVRPAWAASAISVMPRLTAKPFRLWRWKWKDSASS